MHQGIALPLLRKAGLQVMQQQYCNHTNQPRSPDSQRQPGRYQNQSQNLLVGYLPEVGSKYLMETIRRRPHHH
jgi:hypothetical protein